MAKCHTCRMSAVWVLLGKNTYECKLWLTLLCGPVHLTRFHRTPFVSITPDCISGNIRSHFTLDIKYKGVVWCDSLPPVLWPCISLARWMCSGCSAQGGNSFDRVRLPLNSTFLPPRQWGLKVVLVFWHKQSFYKQIYWTAHLRRLTLSDERPKLWLSFQDAFWESVPSKNRTWVMFVSSRTFLPLS